MVHTMDITELHRTRSVVLGRLQRYTESIEALEHYMLYNPQSPDILECQHTLMLLQQLASAPSMNRENAESTGIVYKASCTVSLYIKGL